MSVVAIVQNFVLCVSIAGKLRFAPSWRQWVLMLLRTPFGVSYLLTHVTPKRHILALAKYYNFKLLLFSYFTHGRFPTFVGKNVRRGRNRGESKCQDLVTS